MEIHFDGYICPSKAALFPLSAHTWCGVQSESDTKGWKKHLGVPVRQGEHVRICGDLTVLGKRKDRTPPRPRIPTSSAFVKELGLGSFIQLLEEAHRKWLDMSFSPPEAANHPESKCCYTISSVLLGEHQPLLFGDRWKNQTLDGCEH